MINKVILRGFVADEPYIHCSERDMLARIRIATIEYVTLKSTGGMREIIEWHTAILHGELAQIVDEQVRIGTPVEVQGKLRNRKWSDRKGVQHETAEVAVERLEILNDIVGYTLPKQIVERMPTPRQKAPKESTDTAITPPAADADGIPF